MEVFAHDQRAEYSLSLSLSGESGAEYLLYSLLAD